MSLKILGKRFRDRLREGEKKAEDDGFFGFGIIRRPNLLERKTKPSTPSHDDERGFLEELRDRTRQRRR